MLKQKITDMKIEKYVVLLLLITLNPIWAQQATVSETTVKVLSFNILHGATTKGDFDLDAIAKVINDNDPDFVALQEVDFRTERARDYDLVTELGWRSKMAPIFGKAMAFDGGEYGEGVLSKHTFISTRNVALPYTQGNEPRAALEITTILPSGDTIAFIGTHLDHLKDETDRVKQAKAINEAFRANRIPTLIAGDLNARPGSTPMNILESMWEATYNKKNPQPTFPSDDPQVKIDYIMAYPKNTWKVLDRKVICDTIASDHCSYLVTLQLINN
jgi:endonuclease/exonuclease/phosphatase family metal-dependent hydrolase